MYGALQRLATEDLRISNFILSSDKRKRMASYRRYLKMFNFIHCTARTKFIVARNRTGPGPWTERAKISAPSTSLQGLTKLHMSGKKRKEKTCIDR